MSCRDYRYFNDVYLFDLDERKWSKVDPVNAGPSPRSGCQVAATSDGRLIIYGGYSREKLKKDVDRGVAHTDMFILHLDARGGVPAKWRWSQVKQTGERPGPRSGLSLATMPQTNRAYLFGGVTDEEGEEDLEGCFFNDLYLLELDKGHWTLLQVQLGRDQGSKAASKCKRSPEEVSEPEKEAQEGMDQLSIQEEKPVVTSDDGVFTVTIGASKDTKSTQGETSLGAVAASSSVRDVLVPIARMGCSMTIKNGILYLYGGTFEDGDRQFTLADMHALDLHKMDQWKVLVPLDTKTQEWLGSDDSNSEESSEEDEGMDVDSEEEAAD